MWFISDDHPPWRFSQRFSFHLMGMSMRAWRRKEWETFSWKFLTSVEKRFGCDRQSVWKFRAPWKSFHVEIVNETTTVRCLSCKYTNWFPPQFSVKMATSTQANRRPQQRYTRSSTASVTQLLSDSCNSLLQRFRRPPSEKLTVDKTFSLATNR